MKNKIRERESHNHFYTSSLKYELHSVYQDNLSLIIHYTKRVTQSLKDYNFEYKKNTKILDSHKNLNPYTTKPHLQTWSHTRKIPRSKRTTKSLWWLFLANQNMFLNASKPSKICSKVQRSSITSCTLYNPERVSKNGFTIFAL